MQLNMMSLTARPTEAFTPQPSALKSRPSLIPISCAMGPLTTTMGNRVCAVVMTWLTWYSSALMACTAVTRMGMTPGVQPAIMALAATRSTVMSAILGMRRAMTSSPFLPEAATNLSTISRVGGMTGSPSVAPRSKSAPFAPMGSPAIVRTRSMGSSATAAASPPFAVFIHSAATESTPLFAMRIRASPPWWATVSSTRRSRRWGDL